MALLGCGTPRFPDPGGPGSELPDVPGSRLAETTPYPWPSRGELVLLTCRFRTELPIPTALPPDASPEEARLLGRALRAWEDAVPGVRFVPAEPARASVVVTLDGGAGAGGATQADCRLHPERAAGPGALDAELVRATVRIARRTPPDPRGLDRALAPEELLGVALHELGHALGFQGHAARGSVMERERDEVVRRARAVLAGEALDEPTLRALYALPSGAVLARAAVSPARTEAADRLAAFAARRGLAGPFLRAGDDDARVFWVAPGGVELGVSIASPAELAGAPGRLALVTEPRARRALESEPVPTDTRPGR